MRKHGNLVPIRAASSRAKLPFRPYLIQLLTQVPPQVLEAGFQMIRQSQVRKIAIGKAEIFGIVHAGHDYAVSINFEREYSTCLCWESWPCRHTAAVAAQILELKPGQDPLDLVEVKGPPASLVVQLIPHDPFPFCLSKGADGHYREFRETSDLAKIAPELRPYLLTDYLHGEMDLSLNLRRMYLEQPELFASLAFIDENKKEIRFGGLAVVNAELVRQEHAFFSLDPFCVIGDRRVPLGEFRAFWMPASQPKASPREFFLLNWPEDPVFLNQLFHRFSLDHALRNRTLFEFQNVIGIEEIPVPHAKGPVLLLSLRPPADQTFGLDGQIQIAYGRTAHDIKANTAKKDRALACFPPAPVPKYRVHSRRRNLVYDFTAENTVAKRSRKNELALIQVFKQLPIKIPRTGTFHLGPRRLRVFLDEVLPVLTQKGVLVRVHPDLLEIIENRLRAELTIEESSGENWFAGKIEIPGLKAEDRRAILEALRAGRDFTRLSDGRWIDLARLGLEQITRNLESLGLKPRADGTVAKISRGELAALELELELNLRAERHTRKFLDGLREPVENKNVTPGPGFRGQLREYQVEGLGFLLRLHACGTGGILADDMGLGKTVQSLAFLNHLFFAKKKKGPFLIVAPVSALSVWSQEAARFCPNLPVTVWHGSVRKEKKPPGRGLVVTSYGVLLNDLETLREIDFAVVLADEAQKVKNHRARAGQALRAIKTACVICLTGTPLENHLSEFWSLMDVSFPGLLGKRSAFRRAFRGDDEQAIAQLKKRIAPFFLRRRKQEVLKELPPLTEKTVPVAMTSRQAALYEQARRQAVRELKKAGQDYLIKMLPHLMRLRRIACHPDLKNPERSNPEHSGKFQYLAEFLPDLVENTSGVLIFSQFTDVLRVTARLLERAGHDYFYLDGSTPLRSRETQIKKFQAGERVFFLISLKAGGTALTLTRADTVLHLDPWWNPAVERQATDRAHRIGQDRPVMAYRLLCEKTVEEKVLRLQERKRALFDQLFGQGGGGAQVTRQELFELLG